MVKTLTLVHFIRNFIIFIKSLKSQKKEAGTDFVLLCHSRNIVGQFEKVYLHKQIKILHFLTPARIQKYLT